MAGKTQLKFKKAGPFNPSDDHEVLMGKTIKLHNRRVSLFPVESGGEITHWDVQIKLLGYDRKVHHISYCHTVETMQAIIDLHEDLSMCVGPFRSLLNRMADTLGGAMGASNTMALNYAKDGWKKNPENEEE